MRVITLSTAKLSAEYGNHLLSLKVEIGIISRKN